MDTRWILVLLLFPGLLCTAGCLKEGYSSVVGMVVSPTMVSAGEVILAVQTTVEHNGGVGIGPSTLITQAFDTGTGLLVNESSVVVGPMGRGESRTVSQNITLPRKGTYRVVTTLKNNGKLNGKGEITVHSLELLPAESARTRVEIADMDFLIKGVSDDRATIEADIYLTNQGDEPSPRLTAEVKAREVDARLIADKQWAVVEEIRPGATSMKNITLSVPDTYNYDVEVVLWREDVIIGRGTGRVALAPSAIVGEGERFVTREIETGKFVAAPTMTRSASEGGGAPTRAPGFAGLCAIMALLIGAACWRCIRHD